jgi:hypothetical protein
MHENLKGKGVLGWLGRQFGYVAKAVKTDVKAPKIVYRDGRVQEAPHPEDPNLTLRRTVIDEVIVKKPAAKIAEKNAANDANRSPDKGA